jgi:hypothetical protein
VGGFGRVVVHGIRRNQVIGKGQVPVVEALLEQAT